MHANSFFSQNVPIVLSTGGPLFFRFLSALDPTPGSASRRDGFRKEPTSLA